MAKQAKQSNAKANNANAQSNQAANNANAAANTAKVKPTSTLKCCSAKTQKRMPPVKMLQVISKINQHPGVALRIKRWRNYKVGQSLLHCKLTPNLDHLDVLFYVEHGLMELRQPTQAEIKATQQKWAKTATAA